MRTAVCLHGLVKSINVASNGAYDEKFATLLEKIKDCDVFIHSWDFDIMDELQDIFKPLKYEFQPQYHFLPETKNHKDKNYANNTRVAQGDLFKTLSFLKSRKKSIDLKSEYEKENNFKYDCVLVSRFDVGHHKSGLNKTSHLNFNPNQDMQYMYQAYWDQTNAGASDHWFYSNSDNINMLSTLYDNVLDYLSEDSEYTKWCNNGWPLSDANNEFSNELFKHKAIRSENLIKYAYDDVILVNNHCLYKYHLMKNNMWDDGKSVFLNKQFWEYDQTCNI